MQVETSTSVPERYTRNLVREVERCAEWKLKDYRQTIDNEHITYRQETDNKQTGTRQTRDRHHRWRIRLASGSKQAARATPTARSACFVP